MKRNKKFLMLALVFALTAAVLFYQYLLSLQKKYEPQNMEQVIVAARTIEHNSLIGPGDIKVLRVPSDYAHRDALRDKKSAEGKVAVSRIMEGEQILRSRLLGNSRNLNHMSYSVPRGKRAISVAVNDITGVSGFVKPSDRVDVVATVNIPVPGPSGQEIVRPYTVMALQDIEVLAVGNSIEVMPETEGGAKKGTVENKTVTLAVDPRQALILTMAAERGEIRLMLRAPGDKDLPLLAPWELRNFIASG